MELTIEIYAGGGPRNKKEKRERDEKEQKNVLI